MKDTSIDETKGRSLHETDPFLALVYIFCVTAAVALVEVSSEGVSEYDRLQSRAVYIFILVIGARILLIHKWYYSYKEVLNYISGVDYESFPLVGALNIFLDIYISLLVLFWVDVDKIHFVSVPVLPLVYLSLAAGNVLFALFVKYTYDV
jgi:hypothetical protein